MVLHYSILQLYFATPTHARGKTLNLQMTDVAYLLQEIKLIYDTD